MIADPNTIASTPGGLIDPHALMAIHNLEMRARVVVEGFWKGMHRSPYHGFSVEFSEYRQYSPGDDPRYLDWKVFARSDRFFVKKFEEETNLRCHLLVDLSRSMNYGTIGYNKERYAATLAATLGYFLYQQGDAVGLLTFDEQVREFLPAAHRIAHLRHLMLALERPPEGKDTSLTAPLARIMDLVRKRGLIVFISDFLAPVDRLEQSLLALTSCGHQVAIFQILDPAELTLRLDKAAMYEDAETGRMVYIDPAAARKTYVPKLEAHCAALRGICQKLGISYQRVTTEQPLELVLFQFLKSQDRKSAASRRAIARNPGRL